MIMNSIVFYRLLIGWVTQTVIWVHFLYDVVISDILHEGFVPKVKNISQSQPQHNTNSSTLQILS